MPDTVGSLMRRAALAACLTLSFAVRAGAQTPAGPAQPPSSPEFLSRYDFHLWAAALASADQRFSWDTHVGAAIDVVDYVAGRASILADYEAVLGSEFRPFDPNQGNYTLEASSSVRVRGTEIAGVFHHVSRHLGDRPKRFAIAWNVLGVRVLRRFDFAGTSVGVMAGAGRVVQHAYVDYQWTADLDLLLRRRISEQVGVFAHGSGEAIGVDSTVRGRGTQTGGRVEGGVRITGRSGAMELFAGYERRIDAAPFEFQSKPWALVGFRLVSK